MADAPPIPNTARTDRRDALKRLGVGAAAAWAAPTVLSQPSAAAATQPPPVGCRGCTSPAIVNPGAEAGTLYTQPPGWTFNAGTNQTYPYAGQPVVPPPASAVPGLQWFFVDTAGQDGVTMSQVVDVAAPCRDGTHRAVLSFWWIAADYLRASLLFTDGTNPTGSWLGPIIGPTVPTNGIYPFDPFTSPGIPVPAGTTKAVISFLTVIGPNPGPQVGLDVIDLTIC